MLSLLFFPFFFFNDTATTEIYTLSLHDALPAPRLPHGRRSGAAGSAGDAHGLRAGHAGLRARRAGDGPRVRPARSVHEPVPRVHRVLRLDRRGPGGERSEEHTSELQSLAYL